MSFFRKWVSRISSHRPGGAEAPDGAEALDETETDGIDTLCRQCQSINPVRMMRWTPGQWNQHRNRALGTQSTSGHDDRRRTLESVTYDAACPACRILEHIVGAGQIDRPTGKMTLATAYTLESLEDTIDFEELESETRRAYPLKYSKLLYVSELSGAPQSSTPTDAVCICEEKDSSGEQILMTGRRRPDAVEPDLLSGWLRECSTYHTGTCQPKEDVRLMQIRLIDVLDRKVVAYPESGSCKYFTLSYVWGSVRQGRCLPGTSLSLELPDTIADAIDLVQSLGERYLWVDSVGETCLQ